MIKKICFKCNKEKPISEFYKHSQMADGYLNKCKDCAKKDVSVKYESNIKDPVYVENERKRGRDKYHRLYVGTGKSDKERSQRWISRYPEKRAASQYAYYHNDTPDGKENHHWSYLKEHWLDVIFMTKKEHLKAHRFIVYDQERMMYRRCDTNELLDTKARHEEFIKWCIKNKED